MGWYSTPPRGHEDPDGVSIKVYCEECGQRLRQDQAMSVRHNGQWKEVCRMCKKQLELK